MLRRWMLTLLYTLALILSSLWALFAIDTLLYDSLGHYRNPGGLRLVLGVILALSPTWLSCWLLCHIWYRPVTPQDLST